MKSALLPLASYILILITLSSCNKIEEVAGEMTDDDFLSQIFDDKPAKAQVVDVVFSPDFKTFSVTTDFIEDIGPYELSDSSQVRTEVIESIGGIWETRFSTPRLTEIRNIESERLREQNIRLFVLVDCSLPQADLNRIRDFVMEMKRDFKDDNLYVAFMGGPKVTSIVKASDYVVGKYFTHAKYDYTYLYRFILQTRETIMKTDTLRDGAGGLVMLTFSNGKVYDDDTDEPYDPKHYTYQEQMVSTRFRSNQPPLLEYYADFNHDDQKDDSSLLRIFCHNNGGEFIDDFHWVSFRGSMFDNLHVVTPDYLFRFENPDHKVYRGDDKELTVNFYNRANDSLFLSVSTDIVQGHLFAPIIVHGHGIGIVVFQGIFLGCFLFLLIYIVFQLIVPWIQYRLFLRKYVVPYSGRNMCLDNKAVQESCYLCKAPFSPGDKIVVKCQHTMHKSCWDENGYRCPEHGGRCKSGSHYYNGANPFDPHNAPFYLKWLLASLVSSILAWVCFILYVNLIPNSSLIIPDSHISQIPAFGLFIGFFLTLGISTLTTRPHADAIAWLRLALRALVAAMGCYLSFVLVNFIIYLFDIDDFTPLFNWIPWTLSGFIIAYCSTFATSVKHKRLLLLISVFLGFLSMYAWSLLFQGMELDFRVMLLFSFFIFSFGLAACVAKVAPRSEHFFLNIQGASKGMDIALYKWFRENPNNVVTIGKSVDCLLQLSWDIQSNIAPVQAEIRLRQQVLYLIALEPGVYMNGIPLPVGKKTRLYHGRSFTIGQTTFTYLEKDR